jgi:hypothetical protein
MKTKVLGIRCSEDQYNTITESIGTGDSLLKVLLDVATTSTESSGSESDKLDYIISMLESKKRSKTSKSPKLIDMGLEKTSIIDYTEDINFKYIITAWEFWKLFRVITIEAGSMPTVIDKAKVDDWAKHLRIMVDKGESSTASLRKVYTWLKDRKTKNARFWAINIKSTATLRDKMPRMLEQMSLEKDYEPDSVNNNIQPAPVKLKDASPRYKNAISSIGKSKKQ